MACGGTCGGSAPAKKTGGKQPGDVAGGKANTGLAHACKCVCVCGTPTGDPVLSDYQFPERDRSWILRSLEIDPTPNLAIAAPELPPKAPWPPQDLTLWTAPTGGITFVPPPSSGAPGGPGIHAPVPGKPPDTFGEIYDGAGKRRFTSAFALGSGTADVEAPKPLPVVNATWPVVGPSPLPMLRSNAQVLYAPKQLVLDARAAPVMPVEPLVSRSPGGSVQGESSAATAVMDASPEALGAWAYGGAIAPPDATRFPSPKIVSPHTLAPPHAGSFALGGPDAPPGSGIGARAYPVPGSDGTLTWTPARDAAKRTLDSDIDAHRDPLPVRVPYASIEGDLGPGLEPVPRGVKTPDGLLSFRGAVTPPLHPDEGPGASRAALGMMVPLAASLGPAREQLLRKGGHALPPVGSRVVTEATGSYAPPAVPGPTRAKSLLPSAFLQPPSGPWDARIATADAPQVQGYDSGAIRQPPAFPGGESPAAAPEAAADPYAATGRPVQAGLDALKAAMKGVVPVDQWRTPKPEMPGSPTGQKGRGPGLGPIIGAGDALDQAATRRDEAQAAYNQAAAALEASGGDDPEAAREAAYAGYLLEMAREEVQGLSYQLSVQLAGVGSQALDRAAEQKARDDAAQVAENQRRLEKYDTRPNYFAWEQGDIAEKEARGVRGETKAIEDAVAELGDKLDPATAELIGELTDNLKDLGKELKKKGSDAKDHSKGSEEDASAAAEDLQDTKEELDATRRAIEDALAYARGETSPAGPSCGGGGTCGGGGGGDGGPAGDGAKAPAKGPKKIEFTIKDTVWPDCGKEAEVCKPPKTACPVPGDKWACGVVKGDPLPGGVVPKGSKGKGWPGAPSPGSPRPGSIRTLFAGSDRALYAPMSNPEDVGLPEVELDPYWETYGEPPEVLETFPSEEGEAETYRWFALPDGGRIVTDVNGRDIYIPKDLLPAIWDDEEGDYSVVLWRAAIEEMARAAAVPDLDGVKSIDEAEARFEEAFQQTRSDLVEAYSIRKGDDGKLADIYAHSAAELMRQAGMEWAPVGGALLEAESTVRVFRDGNASLATKLVALGVVAVSMIPGGSAARRVAKETFEQGLRRAATEVTTQVVKHGDELVTLKSLSRRNFRENLQRALGLPAHSIVKKEAHHILPVERQREFAEAIVRRTGVPFEVAEKLIHHPRHGVFLTERVHRRLTPDLRRVLRETIGRAQHNPPDISELWKVVKEVHAKHGITLDF